MDTTSHSSTSAALAKSQENARFMQGVRRKCRGGAAVHLPQREKANQMLIGKHIIITEAKNKSIQGKQGTVIDETKNTITIRATDTKSPTQHKDITIIKDQITTITEEPS